MHRKFFIFSNISCFFFFLFSNIRNRCSINARSDAAVAAFFSFICFFLLLLCSLSKERNRMRGLFEVIPVSFQTKVTGSMLQSPLYTYYDFKSDQTSDPDRIVMSPIVRNSYPTFQISKLQFQSDSQSTPNLYNLSRM